MLLLLLSILLSCSDDTSFERKDFEDKWWSIEDYDMCFNVHNESGDFLLYKESISSPGKWSFISPNVYEISNSIDNHYIYVNKIEDCWDILYKDELFNYKIISCECYIYE